MGAAFAAAPVGTVAAGIGAFVLGWNIGGYAEPLASCYAETRTGEGSPNLKTYTNPDGTAGCPAGYSCNEWAYDKPWR